MAKFYGVIGYAIQTETSPGVWKDTIVEKPSRGDVLQNLNRWQATDKVNDDVTLSNKLSIISDLFSLANVPNVRYVHWMGANWKVSSVEIQRPRLILTVGGVYNGPTA